MIHVSNVPTAHQGIRVDKFGMRHRPASVTHVPTRYIVGTHEGRTFRIRATAGL